MTKHKDNKAECVTVKLTHDLLCSVNSAQWPTKQTARAAQQQKQEASLTQWSFYASILLMRGVKTSRQHYTFSCRSKRANVYGYMQLPRVNVHAFRQVQWKMRLRKDERMREGQIPVCTHVRGKLFTYMLMLMWTLNGTDELVGQKFSCFKYISCFYSATANAV